MCLAAVAFDAHPDYLAVVLANRDEFHARPAAPLALWHDRPSILAGRDLQAGGTWMGLEQRSRFGLVTNFRESLKMPQAPTRGDLVPDFLASADSAESHLGELARQANRYAGFNLLLHDGDALWYASNRDTQFARRLPAGVHALSNHLLDTPWPKLLRLRNVLSDWSSVGAADTAPLWYALSDRERAPPNRYRYRRRVGVDPLLALRTHRRLRNTLLHPAAARSTRKLVARRAAVRLVWETGWANPLARNAHQVAARSSDSLK